MGSNQNFSTTAYATAVIAILAAGPLVGWGAWQFVGKQRMPASATYVPIHAPVRPAAEAPATQPQSAAQYAPPAAGYSSDQDWQGDGTDAWQGDPQQWQDPAYQQQWQQQAQARQQQWQDPAYQQQMQQRIQQQLQDPAVQQRIQNFTQQLDPAQQQRIQDAIQQFQNGGGFGGFGGFGGPGGGGFGGPGGGFGPGAPGGNQGN